MSGMVLIFLVIMWVLGLAISWIHRERMRSAVGAILASAVVLVLMLLLVLAHGYINPIRSESQSANNSLLRTATFIADVVLLSMSSLTLGFWSLRIFAPLPSRKSLRGGDHRQTLTGHSDVEEE